MASLFDLLQGGQLPQALPVDPWRALEEIQERQRLINPAAESGPVVQAPAEREGEMIPTRDVAPRPRVGTPYAPPAAAPQPAAPVATAPAKQPPVAGNPIGQFLSGMAQGAEGIIPSFIRGGQAPERENMTVRVLMAKGGFDQETATTIARNPQMLQQVLPQLFAPKGVTLKADEVHFRPDASGRLTEAARGGAKFMPIPEAGGIFNTQEGRAVIEPGQKMPELVKDYQFYVQQELQGRRQPKTFEQWDLERKKAQATNVAITQEGEKSFEREVGQLQAKDFSELVKRGRNAKVIIADLEALKDIGSRLNTGVQAQILASLGPYADALGIKLEGLSEAQAFDAITSRLAPQMRVPGSGATSDFEMRQFLRALPELGRTPDGNRIVSDVFRALEEYNIAASEIASRAIAKEITPRQAEQELRALPDPFTAWKKSRGAAPTAPAAGRTRVWTPGTGIR